MYSSILTLPIFLYNLLDAARSPDPPVFTDVQRYPCICYLPPGLLYSILISLQMGN